jgi:hypothetical protein
MMQQKIRFQKFVSNELKGRQKWNLDRLNKKFQRFAKDLEKWDNSILAQ